MGPSSGPWVDLDLEQPKTLKQRTDDGEEGLSGEEGSLKMYEIFFMNEFHSFYITLSEGSVIYQN